MTKIGDQCEGCSHAYWEGLSRAKTPDSDSSVAAGKEPLPEAALRVSNVNAAEGNIYNNSERALMNAVNRITEIETALSSQANSNMDMVTAAASHVVFDKSHDALRQEQQTLSARINAIYRCIGLLESHQKALEMMGKNSYSWGWLERIQRAAQRSYFQCLPYYRVLSKCKYKLPGIEDLLQFMNETFSNRVSSLVTIYELCSGNKSNRIGHEFRMSEPAQVLSHWDMLHNSDNLDGHATRSVVLVDGLDSITIEIFGNALKLHPLVFVRHLWRNLGRDVKGGTDADWKGHPLSQTPLCSLADKYSPRIALNVEEWVSLMCFDGANLRGLQDLRSIETLGELHGRQEGVSPLRERMKEEDFVTRKHLHTMLSQLGHPSEYGAWLTTESARLETTILRRAVRHVDNLRDLTIMLSKLELCAAATICTITQDSQQKSTRTLVLRSPSRWHESPERTVSGTRYPPFIHDPFKTEGLSPLRDVESRGSVLEALCTVVALDVTATTQLDQTEVSKIVSLSLLKVSVSNVWNMAVSDHLMLVNPGQNFIHEKGKLVEVSDDCSAYLVQRCQRQRDALLLASAVAENLYSAAAESASSDFIDYLKQELDRIKAITTKTETQLRQTEKVLTVRIDQRFRDLQITLAKTQLEESRKAIKQADTVARLTILAFIFIPISAVCGFFGMNIIEVAGDGGFSFWIFGTTLGTVLAMTLLLAFVDSIYAIWNYYASRIDKKMFVFSFMQRQKYGKVLPAYSGQFLTFKVPYVFRWITFKVKSMIASGQGLRIAQAERTKREIDRHGHV